MRCCIWQIYQSIKAPGKNNKDLFKNNHCHVPKLTQAWWHKAKHKRHTLSNWDGVWPKLLIIPSRAFASKASVIVSRSTFPKKLTNKSWYLDKSLKRIQLSVILKSTSFCFWYNKKHYYFGGSPCIKMGKFQSMQSTYMPQS